MLQPKFVFDFAVSGHSESNFSYFLQNHSFWGGGADQNSRLRFYPSLFTFLTGLKVIQSIRLQLQYLTGIFNYSTFTVKFYGQISECTIGSYYLDRLFTAIVLPLFFGSCKYVHKQYKSCGF